MFTYRDAFQAAHTLTTDRLGADLNPAFPIDPGVETNAARLAPGIAGILAQTTSSPYNFDEHCFFATLIVSMHLTQCRVPHAITIGDVVYDDGAHYINATPDSLLADIDRGFNVEFAPNGTPYLPSADAHAWITMPSGEILDPTIRPHMDHLRRQKTFSDRDFETALFWSSIPDSRIARHIPMLTGLAYQFRVVTGINYMMKIQDPHYHEYREWRDLYLGFMKTSYP